MSLPGIYAGRTTLGLPSAMYMIACCLCRSWKWGPALAAGNCVVMKVLQACPADQPSSKPQQCWVHELWLLTLADDLTAEHLHAGGVRDAAVSAVPWPPGSGGRLPAWCRQYHRGALPQAHITMSSNATYPASCCPSPLRSTACHAMGYPVHTCLHTPQQDVCGIWKTKASRVLQMTS